MTRMAASIQVCVATNLKPADFKSESFGVPAASSHGGECRGRSASCPAALTSPSSGSRGPSTSSALRCKHRASDWHETRIPAENLNSGGGRRVLVMPPGMGRSLGDTSCFVFKMGQQISTAFTSGLISKGCNFLVCKDRRGTRYLNFSVPVLHFVGCNSNFGQISTRLPLQCKLTPVASVSPESPPRHHCVAWSNRPNPCEVARSGQLKVTFLESIWPFILGGGVRKYGRKRFLFFQFDR
jgi:hypothetical protein